MPIFKLRVPKILKSKHKICSLDKIKSEMQSKKRIEITDYKGSNLLEVKYDSTMKAL